MRKSISWLTALVVVLLTMIMATSAMATPNITNPYPSYDVQAYGPPFTVDISDFATSTNEPTPVTLSQFANYPCSGFTGDTQITYTPEGFVGLSNSCTVFLTDGVGGEALVSVTFNEVDEPPVDETDPVVEITSPLSGSTLETDSVNVTYTVTDNDAATTCDVVNGSNVSLVEGPNTITVTCTDTAGNQGSDSVEVTYSPPPPVDTTNPEVNITSPADGSTVSTENVALDFTVSDDQDASPTCDRVSGDQVTLNPGANTFTVACTDDAGNTGSDAVTVYYNPSPPTLTVSPGYGLEGDPGQPATYVEFPVTLSHAWHEDIDILYWALPGTAGTNDFESNILIPKLITIPAGSTSTVIKVRIKHDLKKDDNEFLFLLHISCDLGTAGVTTGIIDDDAGG